AYVELVLLLFFSALAAASTIAQEKDRRTFVLLLLTDLRNYEIVLGKVAGSLLQIGLFLAGSVPFLALLMLLGGIAPDQVGDTVLILASAVIAAGSLGGLVALWRDKTFQSLALTVLLLVLYLLLVYALALIPAALNFFTDQSVLSGDDISYWQARLEPFLALERVLDPVEGDHGLRPALAFGLVMVGWTVLLNGWAMLKLRVWNPRVD